MKCRHCVWLVAVCANETAAEVWANLEDDVTFLEAVRARFARAMRELGMRILDSSFGVEP